MLTLIHILIAFSGVAYTLYLLVRPFSRFAPAYVLIAATICSGVLLAIIKPSVLPHVCANGIIFLVMTLAILSAVRVRRAKYLTVS